MFHLLVQDEAETNNEGYGHDGDDQPFDVISLQERFFGGFGFSSHKGYLYSFNSSKEGGFVNA